MINSEPLLNTLDHIERPEGSIYLKNTIIERIRKHKIPSLDQNGKIPLRTQSFGVKWGASFRWSSAVVIHRLSMLGKMIFNSVRIITKSFSLNVTTFLA